MNLIQDYERFDEQQLYLVKLMVQTIRDELRRAGIVDDDVLHEATGNLAFSLATIIDGSRVMELNGAPVIPCLGFAIDRDYVDIIVSEGGSSMHEYASGVVDEVFEEDV